MEVGRLSGQKRFWDVGLSIPFHPPNLRPIGLVWDLKASAKMRLHEHESPKLRLGMFPTNWSCHEGMYTSNLPVNTLQMSRVAQCLATLSPAWRPPSRTWTSGCPELGPPWTKPAGLSLWLGSSPCPRVEWDRDGNQFRFWTECHGC